VHSVAHPTVANCVKMSSLCHGLFRLPDTAIHSIFQHLSVRDQLALAGTCRRMYGLYDSVARVNNTVVNLSELCTTGQTTNKLYDEMEKVLHGGSTSKLRSYFVRLRALHHRVAKIVAGTIEHDWCHPSPPPVGFNVLLSLSGFGATLKELDLQDCDQLVEPHKYGFGIFHFAQFCPKLERINLSGCTMLSDRSLLGLDDINCPKLTHVGFDQMNVSEPGLARFGKHHPELVSASLAAIALTNDGLARFSEQCPRLEHIDITDNDAGDVDVEGVVDLVQRCPALKSITFNTYDGMSPDEVLTLVSKTRRKCVAVELTECECEIGKATISFTPEYKC
jgi:hypothetical protein